jgi:prefoldin subunit 5
MSDKNETDKLAIDIEEYTKKINEIDSKIASINAKIKEVK